MVFANNAVYCPSNNFKISDLSGVTVRGNVIVPTISQLPIGGYQVGRSAQQDYMDAAGRDLYPTPDSPLLEAQYTALLAKTSPVLSPQLFILKQGSPPTMVL